MKRFLTLIAIFAIAVCNLMAQSSTTVHTVQRGETLASIAAEYGVTEKQIIEANPDAAQFIYVGMELTIPVPAGTAPTENQTYTSPEVNQNSLATTEWTPSPTSKEEYTPYDFIFWSISYFADFDAAGEGCYMLGSQILGDSGWGADFHIGTNVGLVDKDFAGVMFLVGPAYGHVFDNVLVSSSLDFVGSYAGTGKKEKTGTNAIGEEIHYKGNDLKFNLGISLMPKIAIKLGKVTPVIGINATWTKGVDKLSIGFQVGVGFNI